MLVYLHVQTTSFVLQVQQLFQAEVPERIIQKTTGHRSLESLCTNEHNSNDQQQAVSQVMMLTDLASSTGELKKVTTQQVTVTQDTGSASASNMGKLLGTSPTVQLGRSQSMLIPTYTRLVTKRMMATIMMSLMSS